MPELPEVETLSRQLQGKICEHKILSSKIYDKKLVDIKNIWGRRIVYVRRTRKMISIRLDDGKSILIHLRMTGRLFWQDSLVGPKYSRLRISFDNGNLFLVDPRRFATVKILKEVEDDFNKDIFKKFDLNNFIKNCGGRRTKIKSLIMDQRFISGIGNIYACEILFKAGINPERIAASLEEDGWRKIFHHAREILKVAIKKRGTSISDWRDLYGCKGENQHELKVYGREGKNCCLCGSVINRIKQSGRSTFYCPNCQK
jgi:formamidopyrimidine-DNA glycosylase